MKSLVVILIKARCGVCLLCILILLTSTSVPSYAQSPAHTDKWLFVSALDAYTGVSDTKEIKDWVKAAMYFTAYMERDPDAMLDYEHREQIINARDYAKDVIDKASRELKSCEGRCPKIANVRSTQSRFPFAPHSDTWLISEASGAFNKAVKSKATRSDELRDWATAAMYFTAYIERGPDAMRDREYRDDVLRSRDRAIAEVELASRAFEECNSKCPRVGVRGIQSTQPGAPVAPVYPSRVVYQENFDDGLAQDWGYSQEWWRVHEGMFHGQGHSWATYAGGKWNDFRVRLWLWINPGSTVHLNFRFSELGRYYVGFHENGLYLSKEAPRGTFYENLAWSNVIHSPGRWHVVEISGEGPLIRVTVNDAVELDYSDPNPLLGGIIAFEPLDGASAWLDNIVVRVPAEVSEAPTAAVGPFAEWSSCGWFPVGGLNSHQRISDWCPNGSYMVQFDLDSDQGANEGDSPVVGRAKCCTLPGAQFTEWGACQWADVGPQASHQRISDWCPDGAALLQFDLDGYSPSDGPVVGKARCCRLPGTQFAQWDTCEWVGVGYQKSHEPGDKWYPGVGFLVQFDLDSQGGPHESPIVGQAKFCEFE